MQTVGSGREKATARTLITVAFLEDNGLLYLFFFAVCKHHSTLFS